MQVVFDGFHAEFLEDDTELARLTSSSFTACGYTWCVPCATTL